MTLAREAKSNPQIAVPDVKGVKWFESRKDEKKKKAVDDFFQQVLQLPVGKESVKCFLQPSIPDKQPCNRQQSRDIVQIPDAAVGLYEEVTKEFFQIPRTAMSSADVYENSTDTDYQRDDDCFYTPVIKKTSGPAKTPQTQPPPPSNQDSSDTYAEISTQIQTPDCVPESPSSLCGSTSELQQSPVVPPKIALLTAQLSQGLVDANTKNVSSESFTGDIKPVVSTDNPVSTLPTLRTGVSRDKLVNSIPPMPSFVPPPMVASGDLPDTVEPVATSSVNIVAVADYASSSEDILSFTRGTLGLLVIEADGKWWCIKLDNAYGWVPADFWRKINPDGDTVSLSTKSSAPWFVGKLTRAECENLLMEHGKQQHFVVRESTNLIGHYALSVKYNNRVHHFPIELTDDNKYYIGKHHFKTVQSVISYYKKNALFYDDNDQGVSLGSPLVIVKQ